MSKNPMYRQIAEKLQAEILSGILSPGDALPSEAQLGERFSVSRVTVRQALKALTDQGIIESIRGSGSYVRQEPVNYDVFKLTSFYEKLPEPRVDTHSEVLVFEVVRSDERISKALQLTIGALVYYVKRVRFIKQKPVILEETWMPLELFPDLSYPVMQGSKYDYIENTKKLVIDHSEQEILAVLPPDDAVDALGLDRQKPIIEKISRGFLLDGTVFEYSRNFFKSDDYKFTIIAHRTPVDYSK